MIALAPIRQANKEGAVKADTELDEQDALLYLALNENRSFAST
jgi:hypothetical protein